MYFQNLWVLCQGKLGILSTIIGLIIEYPNSNFLTYTYVIYSVAKGDNLFGEGLTESPTSYILHQFFSLLCWWICYLLGNCFVKPVLLRVKCNLYSYLNSSNSREYKVLQ